MKFRPCIDLHNGKVKQIVGGSLNDSGATENFISDKGAAYYAEIYKRDGLAGGHVIMLGPGNEDEAMAALKAYPGGLQIGGGITPDNACRYLDAGASHVIVTSFVFNNGLFSYGNLEKMIKAVGRERLVIDLSCRRKENSYFVVTERWQNFTSFEITRENIAMLEEHCDEFLVHAVDVEGMKEGVDSRLVSLLCDYVSIPVTYAGGVRDFRDIEIVFNSGKGKIDLTIGSALDIFGGTIPYSEILKLKEFRSEYEV